MFPSEETTMHVSASRGTRAGRLIHIRATDVPTASRLRSIRFFRTSREVHAPRSRARRRDARKSPLHYVTGTRALGRGRPPPEGANPRSDPRAGYLDDLVLVPLGVLAVRRMIPDQVMTECRAKAQALTEKPTNSIAAAVIVLIWLALTATGAYLARSCSFRRSRYRLLAAEGVDPSRPLDCRAAERVSGEDANVAPQAIPVSRVLNRSSRSARRSRFTSFTMTSTGAASVPVAPNRTVAGSTVRASKLSLLRIATGMTSDALRGRRCSDCRA